MSESARVGGALRCPPNSSPFSLSLPAPPTTYPSSCGFAGDPILIKYPQRAKCVKFEEIKGNPPGKRSAFQGSGRHRIRSRAQRDYPSGASPDQQQLKADQDDQGQISGAGGGKFKRLYSFMNFLCLTFWFNCKFDYTILCLVRLVGLVAISLKPWVCNGCNIRAGGVW